jgi:hypothetical protein
MEKTKGADYLKRVRVDHLYSDDQGDTNGRRARKKRRKGDI